MKRLLVLAGILVSMAAAQIVFAQPEGVITYETKVNLHRTLPPGQEDRKAIIPEFRTTKQQLFFNTNESLFKPLIEDEDEAAGGHGGPQIMIRIPNNETYINQSTSEVVSKNEFFGKDYLVLDTVKVKPWKFGTETKDIQGYTCKQAFYTDDSGPRKLDITAWYTDKIRTTLGPERFGTLPGTVLAVDINNGERVVVARKIELRPLKKNEMKVPSSGQKMTTAEYRKMVDEQMKKMGGNGGMVIRN